MTTDTGKPDELALTDEERRAIAALERLAKRWPQSLTLFSTGGSICIVRTDSNFMDDLDAAVITHIEGIPNDGGEP